MESEIIKPHQRYQGALLGLAAGDAVGTTLEFQAPGSFEPITDMVGGGPFRLKAGQWTDDTSMALCLADSLLACNGFDANDQMQRYTRWWRQGYRSSTGRCFDIGNTVQDALASYAGNGEPFAGSSDPFCAGNGSIMRLAPLAIFYSPALQQGQLNPQQYLDLARDSSRTTHGAKECLDACALMAWQLHMAFEGCERDEIIYRNGYQASTRAVTALANGDYTGLSQNQLRGSGYVIDSLKAALWCFTHTESFAGAILMAANLGDDADTTAAICGQYAGAFYGVDAIPAQWRKKIWQQDEICALAFKLTRRG